MQLSLISHSFCICELIYLLKLICNPQISPCSCFCGHLLTRAVAENLTRRIEAEVEQGDTWLFSCFSSHAVSKGPFLGLISATFLCFLLVILHFKWTLSVVLKCCAVFLSTRKLKRALWRRYMWLGKLHSGRSYRAVGCEFTVNEPTAYYHVKCL